MFAKFGVRHQVRIFLPGRYDPLAPPAIPSDTIGRIYNQALLPAVRECVPELAPQWPNNYQHALNLARGAGGQIGTVTHDIPPGALPDFADVFLEKLATLGAGFQDAFFEVEARGIKAHTLHNPGDEGERREALEALLSPLDLSLVPAEEARNQWFVDAALDIYQPGYVLQWLSAAHGRLVRHALPHLQPDMEDALLRSQHYHHDASGHLTDLAGFRLEPRSRGRADHVVYVNVYTYIYKPVNPAQGSDDK